MLATVPLVHALAIRARTSSSLLVRAFRGEFSEIPLLYRVMGIMN